jgi:hypothetical protein
MAILTIEVNIPDEKLSEMIDAINWEMNPSPLVDDWTLEQCRTVLEVKTKNDLKNLHSRHQQYLATQVAKSNTIEIT